MWMAAHSIAQKGKSQSAVAAIGEIGDGAEISWQEVFQLLWICSAKTEI